MAVKGQALKGALATMPRQAPLRGDARKNYQAAAQAAQAAGEAPPPQQQFRPQQPRPMARPQQTGQTLAGAVGNANTIGNQIGMLQPGQSPADVAGAVAGEIAAQPQQGAWWQQQQQFGPPPGSLPMTKPGMPPMPQMPQPSANHGGQYRLSPGVYGSREQAMNQYEQQMQPMYQPINGLPQGPRGNLGNIDFSQMVPYGQRRK